MGSSRKELLTGQRLESALGLKFRDPALLQQALVHRSLLNEQGGQPEDSYERMEYLGDAVLELTVSTELFRRFPLLDEGDLTKLRSSLVRGDSLAKVARRLNLGDFILLGKGEETTGGRERDSILAAAFEAVVAAVYLDQGYEQASQFVAQLLGPELEQISLQGDPLDNPKSGLQERVQAIGLSTPKYRLASSEGPDHNPLFTVEVLVDGEVAGTGQGGRRSDAEKSAARDALSRIQWLKDAKES
jgi:ribonuclease-3